ncbi:BrnT family toxin [Enterovirga sp. CN4-39]|uniref:BrnT family toxin n=1 Tax=Enterovirga sp. CN4-39 TaxID=3400910 RepID=UPI003BFE5CE5
MRIVWDEPKRLANLDKHELDFGDLDIAFFEASLVVPAKDGRLAAIGWSGDRALTVIFAMRGTEAISVVSMRPASAKERRFLP